jgi:putative membrane protein
MNRVIAVISIMLSVAPVVVARADVSNSDRDFVTKAAEAGLAEIAEARVALKNSQRPDVQIFARRMIADHTKAHEQLKSIAKAKGIEMPNAPSDQDLMRLKAMGALAGNEFDNAYIKQEVEDHDNAVALFTQESNGGQDAQLKAFAAAALPTLKDHDTMAHSLPLH